MCPWQITGCRASCQHSSIQHYILFLVPSGETPANMNAEALFDKNFGVDPVN